MEIILQTCLLKIKLIETSMFFIGLFSKIHCMIFIYMEISNTDKIYPKSCSTFNCFFKELSGKLTL